ncbi:hypothetical protein JW911_05150 [Candidatus Peregrinibacteria bacterium]|nr:hypothetical protein [Candidatus Peregrinibacteria bacterium]
MKTKNMLTAGLIAVMVMLESSAAVFAAENTSSAPDLVAAKHEQVRQAILNGDFSTWYGLLTENGKIPKILEIITQDKFAKFSEAIKTLDELGLKGPGIGMGISRGMGPEKVAGTNGMRQGIGQINPENGGAIEEAILNGDYDAWYNLMTADGNTPKILDVITKDNFAKFSEATKLFKDGNKEEAAKIFQELGLDKKFMVKKWMKKGTMRSMKKGQGQAEQPAE